MCSSGASLCSGTYSYWEENVSSKINCRDIPVFRNTQKYFAIPVYQNNQNTNLKIASWTHLLDLYKFEADGLVKMSYTKPIVRQSEATCLRAFCKGTYTATINHPGMRNVDGREHIAAFIKIVVNWWKILNAKSIGVDVRYYQFVQTFTPSLA